MLLLGAFLLANSGLAGAELSLAKSAAEKTGFQRYEVVAGLAKRQTILAGFFLNREMAEIAALSMDEKRNHHLRIYAFARGEWTRHLDATLPADLLFVDVANIAGRDRLILCEPGGLSWFDPESASPKKLVKVACSFTPPRQGEIPHVDITRDLNGDGRDELMVPDVDGFWVFVQTSHGTFADPVKIGRSADLSRIYGADGYRFDPWSQSRVHEIDYNHDGRTDLVWWNKDHFKVHLQDERGRFAPVARTFTAPVSFDSDDLSSLAAGKMTGRVLHSLADLNGDRVGDLVVHSLGGNRISNKRSQYEVHFGARNSDGGTVFASEASLAFHSKNRIHLSLERRQVDRSGQAILILTTIETEHLESSLWKRIKGFMGDDVVLNLEFYRTGGGLDPDQPGAIHRIALDGVPSHREPGSVPLDIVLRGGMHEKRKTQTVWPRAFNRTWLLGDVTGDGRLDLLIEPEFRELNLFVGLPEPNLFARLPKKVEVLLHDGEYAWLADLNKDGKQDIIVHQPFTRRDPHGAPAQPPGTEPHRLAILMAQ